MTQEENQEPAAEQQPTPVETPPEVSQEVSSTEYNYADHRTYAQAVYGQPVWVVDAVFGPGGLDKNVKHTPATVQAYINQMMQQPDKQFEGVQ